MHNRLASLLPECTFKVTPVVFRKIISGNWLTTILVYSLQDLIPCRISKTGEEREEFPPKGGICRFPEDDLVQLAGILNL